MIRYCYDTNTRFVNRDENVTDRPKESERAPDEGNIPLFILS